MKNKLYILFFAMLSCHWLGATTLNGSISVDVTDCTTSTSNDGSVDLSINGGFAPFDFVWSSGEITEDINNLPPGEYCVTVTDALCGEATICTEVCSPLDISFANLQPCPGESFGQVSVDNIQGGQAPYTYLWNNGDTDNSLEEVGASTYCVTITDTNGCIDHACQELQIDPSCTVDCDYFLYGILIEEYPCFNLANGEMTVHLDQGYTAHSYLWSNGTTSATLSDITAGTYCVTVTDVNACTEVACKTLNEQTNPLPFSLSTTAPTGPNATDGAISANISGGNPPYQYYWTGPNGFTSTASSINGLAPGYYCLRLRSPGCHESIECVQLKDECPPLLLAIDHHGFIQCEGETGTFTAIPTGEGAPPLTYAWSNGGTTATITDLDPGYYSVTVTDAVGCFESFGLNMYILNGPIVIDAVYNTNPPTSCSSEDGNIRILSVSPTGGEAPFTYHWEDEDGNILTDGPDDIGAGIYYLIATDANGCTGSRAFDLFPDGMAQFNSFVEPACDGQENGYIGLLLIDGFQQSYDMIWSNGQEFTEVTDYVELFDLAAGEYCVTITGNTDGCEISDCYTVTSVTPDGPLQLSAAITHTCPGQSTGAIDMTVTGGVGPYTYDWIDLNVNPSLQSPDRILLAEGVYCVIVTDYCGTSSLPYCSVITAMSNPVLTPIAGCRDEGEIQLDFTGGTPPYNYTWSNGANTQNLTGLNTDNYCVTITDARGCVQTVCTDLVTKDFKTTENLPCTGFNDGSVTLHLRNPELDNVTVLLEGAVNVDVPAISTEMEVPVENLTGGITYNLQITIGECVYDYPINLDNQETENVFTGENDDTCFYDVYCDGNLIAEDGLQTSVFYDYNLADGGFLSGCDVPGFCGDEEVTEKDYSKKWVRAYEYWIILSDAYVNSPFSIAYLNSLVAYYNSLGLTPCSRVRYCPANLRIVGRRTLFDGFNGITPLGGNCFDVDCKFPSSDFTVCLDEVVPDYFTTPPSSGTTASCEPRQYNVYQLAVWHDELISEFPEYNSNSALYILIQQVLNDPDLLAKAKCADVQFCKTDFSILYTNIYDLDEYCDLNIACESVYWDPNTGTEIVNCPIPCISGWCNNSVVINHTFVGPAFFFTDPNGGVDEVAQTIPTGSVNSSFLNFGYAQTGQATVPKGLFDSNTGRLFNDYIPYASNQENFAIPQMTQYVEDWDLGSYTYLEEVSATEYNVVHDEGTSSWMGTITSTNPLEINYLSNEGGDIYVGGLFDGDLNFQSKSISQTASPSGFLVKLDSTGQMLESHIVENVDASSGFTFTNDGNGLSMRAKAANSSIIVNGTSQFLGKVGKVFRFTPNNSGNGMGDEVWLESGNDLKAARGDNGKGNTTYAVFGQGNIEVGNTNVHSPGQQNELVVLNTDSVGTLQWIQSAEIPSGTIEKVSMDYGDNGELFVGFTYQGTIIIQGNVFTSAGGQDILLLHLDAASGSLLGSLSYGSSEDERVCDLFFDNGLVYFGGEFAGTGQTRVIGKHRFINLAGTTNNAFVTFVLESDFNNTPLVRQEGQTDLLSDIPFTVFPNPFEQQLTVELQSTKAQIYQIELINTYGQTVWQSEVEMEKQVSQQLDIGNKLNLSTGLYYIKVTDENSNIWTRKVMKVND